MNINYDYQYFANREKLIGYIMGYLVFISTFFICIKLIEVSNRFSLVILIVIYMISAIYSYNITRYSLFSNDIFVFMFVTFIFSISYFYKLIDVIHNGYAFVDLNIYLYITAFLVAINFGVLSFKVSRIERLKNYRIFLNILTYICSSIIIIFVFSIIFINITYSSLNNFVINNYGFSQGKYVQKNNKRLDEYLSFYSLDRVRYEYSQQYPMSLDEVKGHIKTQFNPLNKVEDFVCFSAMAFINYNDNNIHAYGKNIKLTIIFEHFMFILMTLIIFACIKDKYRIKKY